MTGRRMVLIPVEGDLVEVEAPDWQAMAAAIGADLIERVRVDADWSLAVGLVREGGPRPVNRRASLLHGVASHGVPICGDVLIGREGFTGDGVDWLDTPLGDVDAYLSRRLEAHA